MFAEQIFLIRLGGCQLILTPVARLTLSPREFLLVLLLKIIRLMPCFSRKKFHHMGAIAQILHCVGHSVYGR